MMKLSFSYCLKICMRVDKGNMKKNHYQVKFKQGNDKKKKKEWIILLDFLWSWASVTVLKFAWGSVKGKWKKNHC